MTMETIIVAMLGGLGPALVVILIEAGHIRTQKWWEKKADEYIRVINELSNYHNALYKSLNAIGRAGTKEENSGEQTENLEEENKKTREAVRKIAIAGSILISDEAEKALKKLLTETDEIKIPTSHDIDLDELLKGKSAITDKYDEVGKYNKLIGEAIGEIRKCAKKDLGLSKKCWMCKLGCRGLCLRKLCVAIWS